MNLLPKKQWGGFFKLLGFRSCWDPKMCKMWILYKKEKSEEKPKLLFRRSQREQRMWAEQEPEDALRSPSWHHMVSTELAAMHFLCYFWRLTRSNTDSPPSLGQDYPMRTIHQERRDYRHTDTVLVCVNDHVWPAQEASHSGQSHFTWPTFVSGRLSTNFLCLNSFSQTDKTKEINKTCTSVWISRLKRSKFG